MTNWHGQVKETARLSRPKQVVVSATIARKINLQHLQLGFHTTLQWVKYHLSN
jgi:hypothetical protein